MTHYRQPRAAGTRSNRRRCTTDQCKELTRSATRLCHLHRPAVAVMIRSGQVQLSAKDSTMSIAEAITLANNIIDAIESEDRT